MSFVLTKGTDKEDPSEFAYVDACVASKKLALIIPQKMSVSIMTKCLVKFDSGLLRLAYNYLTFRYLLESVRSLYIVLPVHNVKIVQ